MIGEEHKFLAELAAQEIPVIPPMVFNGQTLFHCGLPPIPYTLFPKKGGRALDEFDKDGWEMVGRIIARVHQVGAKHKNTTRVTWRPAVATRHHVEVINKSNYILPDFLPSFNRAAEAFIKQADPLFTADDFILLHGDLHKGNLIHRPNEGIFVVDFDDMCFGPPVQDIWMLLPGRVEQSKNELEWFLKGYETFRQFDWEGLKLIDALRGMRLIHFAAWLAIQSAEPDFPKHFPEAGTKRYWNELIKNIQEVLFSNE